MILLGRIILDKKYTGIKPFKISSNKTVIPTGLPKTLKALVAPTFPEPLFLISIFFSNLANM